ncbi:MAG: chemotaxis protein CheB [bacterium]|nr:chemotaxis protein CheB [bacterium]
MKKTSKRKPLTSAPPPPSPSPRGITPHSEGLGKNKDNFYVVGMGGSAGALSAFNELLGKISENSGLAFVIVQHLLADSKSDLTEILSGKTKLSVREVRNNTVIEPNHVYVIPTNNNILLEDNELRLSPRKREGLNLSIDEFFVSLARGKKNNAIGVILSGTGSDGTLGMKAIREAGGITFAQDKSSAFSAMPDSVIAAGSADYILSPSEIAETLMNISRGHYFKPTKIENTDEKSFDLPEPKDEDLSNIMKLLLKSSDVDFTYYKHGTLKRRIMRRMSINNFTTFSDYINYLQENPKEADSLYQDILINVTNFFRDQDVFDYLKSKILPEIFKSDPKTIRAWVPGCSTGEEVYSLAITIASFMEESKINIPVQIFGTDISEPALAKARSAKYSESIGTSVPPEYLDKFFVKFEGGYEVSQSIRSMCIFAKHNVIKDVPFTKMDIISCRNVLIYLDSVLHKKAFPIFHYALNSKGFLILGTAESATGFQEFFSSVDKNQRIYSKKSAPFTYHLDFTTSNPPALKETKNPENVLSIEKQADKIVLSGHSPAGIIINSDLVIVQFRGDASRYLKHSAGRASFDLVKMVHRVLLATVLNTIKKAEKSGTAEKSFHSGLKVVVEVVPLNMQSSNENYYLVLFNDDSAVNAPKKNKAEKKIIADNEEVAQVEEELHSTIDELQSLVETRDTTNEELRSANEEVMSANEELKSTNEELETTKEELQSTNEELITLNAELQERNAYLRTVEKTHEKMSLQFENRGKELYRKNEFISILAHELRNPLAPILLTIELAKMRGIKDAELKEMVDTIDRQAKLMGDIIKNLLDAAWAMSGKIQIKTEPADFNTLIKHAIGTAQPLMKHKVHPLELNLIDSLPRIFLDPLRIEQILINLISNAIKYTARDGKITLTVSQEREELILRVKDNGIGIAKEMLPKIFDLFSQTNQSLAEFKGGLGVGLMLSRTLAELHGGSLTASSEGLNKGSEFILRLPMHIAAVDFIPHEDADIKTIKLPKNKVLVVDDNVALANAFGQLLDKLGQEVRVVYDGASVSEAINSFKPDIVFMDIIMPNISGYDLIQIFSKDPKLQKIKFVALTGLGEEFKGEFKKAGFDAHLIKPIGMTQLKDLYDTFTE